MKTIDKVDPRLSFKCSEGQYRVLSSCRLTQDKAGRYWLWSDKLNQNLAYRAHTLDDLFKSAISSLLFHIELQSRTINQLQKVNDLALSFASEILGEKEEQED